MTAVCGVCPLFNIALFTVAQSSASVGALTARNAKAINVCGVSTNMAALDELLKFYNLRPEIGAIPAIV